MLSSLQIRLMGAPLHACMIRPGDGQRSLPAATAAPAVPIVPAFVVFLPSIVFAPVIVSSVIIDF